MSKARTELLNYISGSYHRLTRPTKGVESTPAGQDLPGAEASIGKQSESATDPATGLTGQARPPVSHPFLTTATDEFEHLGVHLKVVLARLAGLKPDDLKKEGRPARILILLNILARLDTEHKRANPLSLTAQMILHGKYRLTASALDFLARLGVIAGSSSANKNFKTMIGDLAESASYPVSVDGVALAFDNCDAILYSADGKSTVLHYLVASDAHSLTITDLVRTHLAHWRTLLSAYLPVNPSDDDDVDRDTQAVQPAVPALLPPEVATFQPRPLFRSAVRSVQDLSMASAPIPMTAASGSASAGDVVLGVSGGDLAGGGGNGDAAVEAEGVRVVGAAGNAEAAAAAAGGGAHASATDGVRTGVVTSSGARAVEAAGVGGEAGATEPPADAAEAPGVAGPVDKTGGAASAAEGAAGAVGDEADVNDAADNAAAAAAAAVAAAAAAAAGPPGAGAAPATVGTQGKPQSPEKQSRSEIVKAAMGRYWLNVKAAGRFAADKAAQAFRSQRAVNTPEATGATSQGDVTGKRKRSAVSAGLDAGGAADNTQREQGEAAPSRAAAGSALRRRGSSSSRSSGNVVAAGTVVADPAGTQGGATSSGEAAVQSRGRPAHVSMSELPSAGATEAGAAPLSDGPPSSVPEPSGPASTGPASVSQSDIMSGLDASQGASKRHMRTFMAAVSAVAQSSTVDPARREPMAEGVRRFVLGPAVLAPDRTKRTVVSVLKGHSGSRKDVNAYLDHVLREAHVGEPDGPPFAVLTSDAQLYVAAEEYRASTEKFGQLLVNVLGPTHTTWSFQQNVIRRNAGLLFYPVLYGLGLRSPSDLQRLLNNKNHRFSEYIIFATLDGLMRRLVEAYLESDCAREVDRVAMLPATIAYESEVTPQMYEFEQRLREWAYREYSDGDPTNAIILNFVLVEGPAALAQHFAMRNRLFDLFVASTNTLYPSLFGTAKTTYQSCWATFQMRLASLEPSVREIVIAAMFETRSGNPFHCDGADGMHEGCVASTKAPLKQRGAAGRFREADLVELQTAQVMEELLDEHVDGILLPNDRREVAWARNEYDKAERYEIAARIVHRLAQDNNVFRPTGEPDAVINILGDKRVFPESPALIKSYLHWWADGRKAMLAYMRSVLNGENVKMSRACRPLIPYGHALKPPAKRADPHSLMRSRL